MKTPMVMAVAATLLALSTSLAAAPISLRLIPDSRLVLAGDTVAFDVVAQRADNDPVWALGAYDLMFSFNANMLSFKDAAWGASLGDPLLEEVLTAIYEASGGLRVTANSLLDPSTLDLLQPAAFTLFTLSFTAVADGTAAPLLQDGTLVGAFGNEFRLPEPPTDALLTVACIAWATALLARRSGRRRQ